jgi:hypothetical protein
MKIWLAVNLSVLLWGIMLGGNLFDDRRDQINYPDAMVIAAVWSLTIQGTVWLFRWAL